MFLKRCGIILLIIFTFCGSLFSSEKGNELLFLTFQITGDQVTGNEVTLVDSRITSGTLKERRTETKISEINFEVFSKNENIIQSGGLDDPRIEILEYEDPGSPATLKQVEVIKDTANFIVRVQTNEELSYINFYRFDITENKDGSINRIRVDLGNIDLSSNGGDQ